jgi:glycosyltransferase involved in cell wall biosynthesis
MAASPPSRILCLSNVYDENYRAARSEPFAAVMSSPKRRDLFRCLEMATGRELVVLSSPPKATQRRRPKLLPRTATRFSTHQQLVCANLDAPKIRIPCSWFSYAAHVLRHTRHGDLLILDNFELLYVLAARLVNAFRKVTFVLDYEDGKHLIDRGWARLLSGTAELWGRGLMRAAFVTHPALGARLPKAARWELVPGFVVPATSRAAPPDSSIRFVYAGSLDEARGIDLLVKALELLPSSGWTLDVAGSGPLETKVALAAADARWSGRVVFHGALSGAAARELVERSHVALNCQREGDPVSSVTFPSKIFSYLSAGVAVISSRASEAPAICGNACAYYDHDTPQSLADVMKSAIVNFDRFSKGLDLRDVTGRYSMESTAARLKALLEPVLMGC